MPITKAFILAKNEEPNIGRCLDALAPLDVEAVVLDSGSTDRTVELASSYGFVRVEPYSYENHLTAYNEISLRRLGRGEFGLVLDADMVVSGELFREASRLSDDPAVRVVSAPVAMCCEGHPLRFGSLCPPKAFALRGGAAYFEAAGHGERLEDGVTPAPARSELIHDDRKDYESYLRAQVRYSKNLVERARDSDLTWRDRVRTRLPLMVAVTPAVSLVFRLGFLSGKAGLLYALDRLIAEAIQYRQVLASRLRAGAAGADAVTPAEGCRPAAHGQPPAGLGVSK